MSDGFNPKTQVKRIERGKGSYLYLQVNDRVRWFREENVAGIVDSELVQWDPDRGVAVVKATVTIPGAGTATGLGSACRADLQAKAEKKSVQPDQIESYVEFAETAAIGRALGRLGYGTDDALSEDGPVDSPREVQANQAPNRPPAQASAPAESRTGVGAQGRTAPATNGAASPSRAAEASTHENSDPAAHLATAEQITRIRALVQPAGKTVDGLCADLRVVTLGNLSSERADKLIARLQELADARAQAVGA